MNHPVRKWLGQDGHRLSFICHGGVQALLKLGEAVEGGVPSVVENRYFPLQRGSVFSTAMVPSDSGTSRTRAPDKRTSSARRSGQIAPATPEDLNTDT